MSLSVYDINTYLKADSSLTTIAGKVISFLPVVATNTEAAPFVVYFYNPMVPNVEAYWLRKDSLRYSIFDTDASRLFDIAERFIYLLSRGDEIAKAGGAVGTNSRILSSYQTGSSLAAPLEKEGWFRMNLDFKICNV